MRRLLLTVLGALLVAGCGIPVPSPVSPGSATASSASVSSTLNPTAITIPSIGARSTLVPLGLTPEGALEVPPVNEPGQAGWYSPGPEPGQSGPAVIAGHVDGVVNGQKGQPGIFYRLREMKPGDEVLVDRADGSQLRFRVERVEHHDKGDFPTAEVYGNTPGPEIRLITCGGQFNREAHSYEDNVIVWGVLA